MMVLPHLLVNYLSPQTLIYELEAYIGAHSIFTTHPHLPVAALVQAIKWHLYYLQTDLHGGEFSFVLPDNPAIHSCLGWVACQAMYVSPLIKFGGLCNRLTECGKFTQVAA